MEIHHTPFPPLTSFDTAQSIEVVWAALERLPEGSLTDEERDDLSTAMAWIKEALENDKKTEWDNDFKCTACATSWEHVGDFNEAMPCPCCGKTNYPIAEIENSPE